MGVGREGKKRKRKETKTESPYCVLDTRENVKYKGPGVETHCSRNLKKHTVLGT